MSEYKPGALVLFNGKRNIVNTNEGCGSIHIWPQGRVNIKDDSLEELFSQTEIQDLVWKACGEDGRPYGLSDFQEKMWNHLSNRTYFCEMLMTTPMQDYEFKNDKWAQEILNMVRDQEPES